MINLIQSHVDFSAIPLHVRKYLSLADELLDRVQVVESGEAFVSVAPHLCANPFWYDFHGDLDAGEPENVEALEGYYLALYVKNHPDFSVKVRTTVLEHLITANELLRRQGYQLSVRIGYRPLEVQQQLFDSLLRRFAKNMPHLSPSELVSEVRNYVSDPSISEPPHCTGAAVDVELLTLDGKRVDMGSPINHAGHESHVPYDQLPEPCLQARMILCNAMLESGFANLATEWWHFSYGDQIWAYFYGKKFTLYRISE